jgi:hypothetical protein
VYSIGLPYNREYHLIFFEYLKNSLDLFKCRGSDISGIGSWDWNMTGQHSTYHALYPRAWTVYDGITVSTEFSFG